MTTELNSAPAYRLGFAPFTGSDRNGQPKIGYPVEIGAAFHRKDREKGLVAKFTFLPADFTAGVLFLMPIREEQSDPKSEAVR